ncbi:MAG: endonuclease/exonuclease/phosphatase family protein, partial [Planctomycetota bacterium]
VANGPVGFFYSPAVGEEPRQRLAIRLVSERYCPLVLLPDTETSTWAYSADGVYHLPEDAAEVLGETHPFRDDVAMDLVRLANHVDAGSLVLCGWDKAGDSIAFPQQHGAHAGPGTEETHAFVTAPAELPLATVKRGYARPIELRQAVLDYFAKDTHTQIRAGADSSDSRVPVRVMTYNVHACVGMDNRLSIERIARVIARSRADIVALQELDAPRQRSGGVDQAREIARQLEMIHHFHPAWSCEEEQFGDAILSRHPVKLVKAGPLAAPRRPNGEPRGVLWVEVTVDGQPLQVLNTHLAVTPKDRLRQLESLVGDDWLGLAMATGPLVLCGDFNLGPTSSQYRVLSKRLIDTQVVEGLSPAQPTWLSWRPVTRIDHIFTTADLEVLDTYVVSNQLAKHASDHLPLVADLVLPIVQNTNVSASRICMASDEREI